MGIVHRATLSPTKQEIVEAWLPGRPWAGTSTAGSSLEKVAEYRYDDPAGEVGVETILWRTVGGTVLQVPLTYRSAPLPGAEQHLVTTTQHSVLGERWVYDGCGDPVWASTLTTAILTGARQSQMFLVGDDGERVDVPARMQVWGSGDGTAAPPVDSVSSVQDVDATTVVRTNGGELVLARVLGTPLPTGERLLGTVPGSDERVVLAAHRS